jgi:hypothetical protein
MWVVKLGYYTFPAPFFLVLEVCGICCFLLFGKFVVLTIVDQKGEDQKNAWRKF